MKKQLLFIILLLLITPTLVNAETNYLYDVLKNEAESNGLAKEYTGEHHDSFTEEPSYKIYHWYAENDEESNQISEKNNVIFGGFCWKMYRTTDIGGVKLIYNGVPRNNNCVNYLGNGDIEIGSLIWVSVVDDFYFSTDYEIDPNTKKFIPKGDVKKGKELDSIMNRYMFQTYDLSNTNRSIYYMIGDHLGIAHYSDYGNNNSIGKNEINSNFPESLSNIGYLNSGKYPITNLYVGVKNNYSTSTNSFGYSDTYELINGYYYLQNPITIQYKDIKDNINNLKGKYSCFNSSNNCDTLFYIQSGDEKQYTRINSTIGKYNYYKDANYHNGKYHLTGESVSFDEIKDNLYLWNQYGYYCNDGTMECENVSFIYKLSENDSYSYSYYHMTSILLKNGEKPSDVIENITNNNSEDSYTKKVMDIWYKHYLNNYSNFLQDVIYCNNRELESKGKFDTSGSITDDIVIKQNISLKCPRLKDSLSINNESAKIDYPVGLMNYAEAKLLGQVDPSYQYSVLMDSNRINNNLTFKQFVYDYSHNKVSIGDGQRNRLKPVVTLKKDATYSLGSGTMENPYIFDKIVSRYKINVNIKNETKDLNININDLSQVPEGEEVNFKITPIKGRKLTNIKIVDENNNEIEYTTTDNINYKFNMPSSNITIIPSYERVKNAVNVEDNINTKEFVIEVNDTKAVVYEDTVRFRLQPEEGYEVEKIEITDEENNNISYKKTNNINEYEFIMPDTNVTIKPQYRKIDSSKLINPNTRRQIIFIIISIIVLGIITTIYSKKKRFNTN